MILFDTFDVINAFTYSILIEGFAMNTRIKLSENEYIPIPLDVYERVRKQMLEEFKQTQMDFELELYSDRQKWILEDPLSAWFLKTRERTAIFHRFNLNLRFPSGHTVSMLSKALDLTRSSTSRLLSEAHSLGYIYRNKEQGYQRYYLPSQHLLRNGEWYSEYYVNQILARETNIKRFSFFNYKRVEKLTRNKMSDDHVDQQNSPVII